MPKISILFSDLDGTCVHYPGNELLTRNSTIGNDGITLYSENGLTASILRLPPASGGSIGIISVKTLQLYAAIRALGVKVVFITGARFSTFAQRLPYLPAADAYVCESGGRIFFPNNDLPTAAAIREDFTWRQQHEGATGSTAEDAKPPQERQGDLWEIYRKLQSDGAKVDAVSYTTAFRVRELPDGMNSKWLELLLPPSLSTAVNLGTVDIYPSTSGKANAARHLMNHFGCDTDGSSSIFMCGTF